MCSGGGGATAMFKLTSLLLLCARHWARPHPTPATAEQQFFTADSYRHLWRRSPHCHRPDHCGCSLRRRWCCRSGTQGHFRALRRCQWAGGWHSPWQWGSPGWGTQCVAPSWQTQAVQASGSQRAPSGQARPSPQHWGEAAWHSQDSSCLTLPCRSLFWGERWG